MSAPVTLVCGFGRCGSSLTMQMLAAGGMPATAPFPAFEDDRAIPLTATGNDAAWLASCAGYAVKLLDPQRFVIPAGIGCRVIWCSRDPEEQGRSQAKFARLMLGLPAGRREARLFAKSYREDKRAAVASLAQCGPILDVAFEKTLSRPWDIAREIAEHCSHHPLDVDAMARAVQPRHPACAPGLEMELSLIERRA